MWNTFIIITGWEVFLYSPTCYSLPKNCSRKVMSLIHVLSSTLPQALTHNIYFQFIVLSVLFYFMYELLPLTKIVRCFLAISACLERHWSPTYLFTPHSVNTWKYTHIQLILSQSIWCSTNSLFSAYTLQILWQFSTGIWIIWFEQGWYFTHENI